MACAAPSEDHVEPAGECPVCKEKLADPYTLLCGHTLCITCLKRIASEHPQESVKCPTCRLITKFAEGIAAVKKDIGKDDTCIRYCGPCGGKKVPAEKHCYQCKKNVCTNCLARHKLHATESHKTVPITTSLFCTTHADEVVRLYCQDCNSSICLDCIFTVHGDHKSVEIETMANERRERLRELKTTMCSLNKDMSAVGDIKLKLEEARKLQSDLTASVSQMEDLLKKLTEKLSKVKDDTQTKLSAEIKGLTIKELDINNTLRSRQRLIDRVTYLIEEASDPELLEEDHNIQGTGPSAQDHTGGICIELPTISDKFTSIGSQLEQMISDCEIDFRIHIVTHGNINEMETKNTITVGHKISALTMDVTRRRLVARTEDIAGPIKVYDYQGVLQETIGAGVNGLACGNNRGICIDSERDCYLAVSERSLLVISREGALLKTIQAGGDENRDIAYSDREDIYVMSDCGIHTIFMINPKSSLVIKQFGSKGNGDTMLNGPYHVHINAVTGIDRQLIIVSDYSNHAIKLFDSSGNHVKTYSSPEEEGKKLSKPGGICVDSQGHLIVANFGNKRTLCIWTDPDGQEHCEPCDHGQSWHMALDPMAGILARTYDANSMAIDLLN